MDHAKFIKIWQTSPTMAQVVYLTRMSAIDATERAVALRKRGVPLKKFKMGRPRHDWQPYIDLAIQYTPKG